MLLIIDSGAVLLEQRPPTGIWGGLLSLPELAGHVAAPAEDSDESKDVNAAADDELLRAVEPFGTMESYERLNTVTHVFTHYKLHIAPYRITLAQRRMMAAQAAYVWLPLAQLSEAALPAPIKKLLLELAGSN
eukprot:gene12691-12484_t